MGEEDDNRMSNILRGNGCSENLVRKLLHSKKRVKRFSKEEICEAILLLALSTKTYEMLHKTPFFCCLIGRHYQKKSDTSSVGQDFKKSFLT